MERAKVFKDEIIEENIRFLAVFLETNNSCLVLLSEKEDKLGTLAIAVPRSDTLLGPPSSAILVGDKNTISARMLAEYVASKKNKIGVVSIYLQSISEIKAQSILRKFIEKYVNLDNSQKNQKTKETLSG